MDVSHFEVIRRTLTTPGNRRAALRDIAFLALAAASGHAAENAGASGKRKKAHKSGTGKKDGKQARRKDRQDSRDTHAEHWGKRKAWYCLDGRSLRVLRRKQALWLARGATIGRCHACTPDPASVTCANACGDVANNCGATVSCGACSCPPDDLAVTCANTCGEVRNNCDTPVFCGDCICEPDCAICQTCNPLDGLCIVDAATADNACGIGPQRCCGGSCTAAAWTTSATFGESGTGDGQFDHPSGVVISQDTLTAWVSDQLNNRVMVFTRPTVTSSTWTFQTSITDRMNVPVGLAVTSDALTLLVANRFGRYVAVYTRPSASSAVWTYQTLFTGGVGQGIDTPSGLALSADQLTLLVTDVIRRRVFVFTRPNTTSNTWTRITNFGAGTLSNPFDVAIASDTLTAWVSDYNNNNVTVWIRPSASSTSWSLQTTLGNGSTPSTNFNAPIGVAISIDTLTLWAADANGQRISIWTRPTVSSTNWTQLTTFGTTGSGNNQFGLPNGLALFPSEQQIMVTDSTLSRVTVWDAACPA